MTNTTDKAKGSVGVAAGLAVGAALGAAAVALSDKKNQQKVKHSLDKARKWAEKTTEKLKSNGTKETVSSIGEHKDDTTRKTIKEPEDIE